MICILHGYLLEGSGSNLWTRAIVRSLCRRGETVHLMAQENHAELYDFIAEERRYEPDGSVETVFSRAVPAPGRCILHRPRLGETLPVYVWDRYEEFPNPVAMVDLPDSDIEDYLERNTRALERVVRENGITALHANHAVLMSVVALRVSQATGVPYAIMPHGSALEYAVKRDPRFHRMAEEAFARASRIFVIGDEMRGRVRSVFPDLEGLESKLAELHLGVDTQLFQPIARAARPANIARLRESVAALPRGKTEEQTRAMHGRLAGAAEPEALQAAITAAAEYDGKLPDADLETKLEQVDWVSDRTLLFVGRLIAAKGVQAVLAALPLLLEREPGLRMVVVGHGPLREPMEAFLWALEHGDRRLVRTIVGEGERLAGIEDTDAHEGAAELAKVDAFLESLRARGELDAYFDAARRHVRADRVIFTGYLGHEQLRHLFPCCDAAVFPSVVREAGPLVFLEALAAGAFPMGTYFGGMKASIDSVADALPPEDGERMKLSTAGARTIEDIVSHTPDALRMERHRAALRRVAEDRYDWTSVAGTLAAELHGLSRA